MERNMSKPLSVASEIANLAINLNESDLDSAQGSSNQKQDENNLEKPPLRRRISLLPTGIGGEKSMNIQSQSSKY